MTPDHKNNRYRLVFHNKTPRQSDLKNLLTKSEIDAKKQEAEKNRAEKAKAENESKKALEETSKTAADKIFSYSKLAIGFASAYGFILLLIYCYTQAKFLPSGLSIGDSVLLLFFSIAFSFIIFVVACLGTYTTHPLIDYGKQKYLPKKSAAHKKANRYRKVINHAKPKYFPRKASRAKHKKINWKKVLAFIPDIALFAIPFILTGITVQTLPIYGDWIFAAPYLKDHAIIASLISAAPFILVKALWTCIALPWYFKKNKLDPQPKTWLLLYTLWFFVELVCATNNEAWFLAFYIQASGLILSLLNSIITSEFSKKENEIKYPNGRAAIVVFVVMLLALPLMQWSALGSSMFNNTVVKPLGLYQDRASLWVSKKNLQRLENAAKLQDIPLSVCKNPDGSAVVTDLKIWWHGIGSRSYVQLLGFSDKIGQQNDDKNTSPTNSIPPEESAKNPYNAYPRVELDSNEASLIASQDVRCTEISDALVFPSNKTQPDNEPSAEEQLAKQINPFIETTAGEVKASFLKKITVIGHADPMPIQAASNEELGRERATHALFLLCNKNLYQDIGNPDIEIKTMGARSPIKDCSSIKDKNLAIECNAVNRRVDLQFSYSKTIKKDSRIKNCSLMKDKNLMTECAKRNRLITQNPCQSKESPQKDDTLFCFCKSHSVKK
ncbi:OmpA family protein [Chromobacterium violaceum]|uniref:OmpA family protein n=1 Tax=Chromobacterium violaceum TaxID=536 RepID=UPI0009B8A0CA|nr:OmpA family protein [Chromobacterium violaceum]